MLRARRGHEESASTPLPQSAEVSLSGWGLSPSSTSRVVSPTEGRHVTALLATGSPTIARGLGRSYGDAAQIGGGRVIDTTRLTGFLLDAESGVVTANAGTSLGEIIDSAIPAGWFLPVTPGTRHVTVGGAIAADVHGKNHHGHGSFGQYVESIELVTGAGDAVTVEPGSDAFSATVGGMGLTGAMTRATFRLIPVESAWMSVDTRRGDDLESVMAVLAAADHHYTYSVAWVDLTRAGRGRGVVSAAEHATSSEASGQNQLPELGGRGVSTPSWMPRVVTRGTVDVFNRLWFAKAPKEESGTLERLEQFFYPLDRVQAWNRLYGKRGFLQYQFVVPDGAEATLHSIAEALAHAATPVSLAVLKRMGPSDGGVLSFPMPGWTLAVDMPLGDARLAAELDDCDRRVAAAGGRVYLAKDSRLRCELFAQMYPDLGRWREIRSSLDPEGRMGSDLARRLGLTS